MKVVTWQSDNNLRINICDKHEKELEAKGTWPKDSKGSEYCSVYHGSHDGSCSLCADGRSPKSVEG